MKAIMVMFYSLNRQMLSPYGCDWLHTSNFQWLAENTVIFDNSYVGSMPSKLIIEDRLDNFYC